MLAAELFLCCLWLPQTAFSVWDGPTAGQGRAVRSWRPDLLWHHWVYVRGEGLWAGSLKALSPAQIALTHDLL